MYSPYIARLIASDELAAAEAMAEDAQRHDREMVSDAERVAAASAATEAANIYIKRQTERIGACVDMESESCDFANGRALDAQFELRIAAEKAAGVLGPQGLAQLKVVEGFFPHLYDDNVTGVPPDEPVDDAAFHVAAVRLTKLAKEPALQP